MGVHLTLVPFCVFRCVCREQLTVRGGRRRWQLQLGLRGVLQSKLGQVDTTADLHEHRAELCRCVGDAWTHRGLKTWLDILHPNWYKRWLLKKARAVVWWNVFINMWESRRNHVRSFLTRKLKFCLLSCVCYIVLSIIWLNQLRFLSIFLLSF